MNAVVTQNYSKVTFFLLVLPMLIIASVIVFLVGNDAFSPMGYAEIQQETFLSLNKILSQFPDLQHNLTQLGDAFVALSTLSILYYYAPKFWENLVWASLISLIFSRVLKEYFDVPRPATILDNETFTIVGETAIGFSSMPSGHSITIFTTLAVILFGFMPKKLIFKFLWTSFILVLGLILAFTRVGVGAHYPLDVILGSCIGLISGILGIIFCRYFRLFAWVSNPKFLLFFMLLFLGSLAFLIIKIVKEPLVIYTLPLVSLIFSLYFLIQSYVKKTKI